MSYEFWIGTLIGIAGAFVTWLTFNYTKNRDIVTDAVEDENRLKALEESRKHHEQKWKSYEDEKIAARVKLLEEKQNSNDESILRLERMINTLQKSINSTKEMIIALKAEVEMLREIRSTLKDFDAMIRGISRHVAEHGIKLENLKEKIEDIQE